MSEQLPRQPKPRFDFYEIVHVRRTPKTLSMGVADLEGAILGIGVDEQTMSVSYAVALGDVDESWDFDEDELETTGRMAKREDFYDGTTLRVDSHGRVVADPSDVD